MLHSKPVRTLEMTVILSQSSHDVTYPLVMSALTSVSLTTEGENPVEEIPQNI